jgi:hypothetical protein
VCLSLTGAVERLHKLPKDHQSQAEVARSLLTGAVGLDVVGRLNKLPKNQQSQTHVTRSSLVGAALSGAVVGRLNKLPKTH